MLVQGHTHKKTPCESQTNRGSKAAFLEHLSAPNLYKNTGYSGGSCFPVLFVVPGAETRLHSTSVLFP